MSLMNVWAAALSIVLAGGLGSAFLVSGGWLLWGKAKGRHYLLAWWEPALSIVAGLALMVLAFMIIGAAVS